MSLAKILTFLAFRSLPRKDCMCVDPAGAGRIGSNRWEPGHEPKSGESSGYWTHCNDKFQEWSGMRIWIDRVHGPWILNFGLEWIWICKNDRENRYWIRDLLSDSSKEHSTWVVKFNAPTSAQRTLHGVNIPALTSSWCSPLLYARAANIKKDCVGNYESDHAQSPKRHKKDTQAGKWTLFIAF